MTDAGLLDTLSWVVGAPHVLTGDAPAYDVGVRHDRGRASAVVRPATTAEVSAVVAAAAAAGVRVVPQGGNTGLVGASTPDGTGRQVLLSLDRLRAPPVVDPVNRSVTVAAGLRLSEVNAALDPHGLVLPIDLAADPMIGGMVATNTGGARFIRHGDVRRAVLGLEVVLPDGGVLDLLRPLRKNNAGADLKHLFIGAGGLTGVVTRATLEVQRAPQQRATALVVPRDGEAALDLLLAFEAAAGDHLGAFEGMSGEAMRAALLHAPSLRDPFAGAVPDLAILVELVRTNPPREGEQPLDALLEAILSELWALPSAPVADAMLGRGEDFWALRHALSEGVRALGALAAFDLSFARGDLFAFRDAARVLLARDFPRALPCDFGHVGDGALHFNVSWPEGPPPPEEREALRRAVTALAVERFGGGFSAEHGLGRANLDLYRRYTPARAQDLAARLCSLAGPGALGAVDLHAAPHGSHQGEPPR